MDVLLIGSRGREHAMALALKKDKRVENIYCMPGNGGMEKIATCVNIPISDFDALLNFLEEHPSIELTVVNPDETLAAGLVDLLTEKGHRAFGPSAKAARPESDKEFMRTICAKYNIPSPQYKVFRDYQKAKKYVSKQQYPLVVKTIGRTAGKGIVFCHNQREAENALYDIMIAELFGDAGKEVDIEEFLDGENVIVMTLTDGKTVVPLPAVKGYKRVFDNDLGLSTAGMGAYLPAEAYTEEIAKKAYDEIYLPMVKALATEGCPFKGVLSYSLIITKDGPKVADVTVRFCDVESQVCIPLLKTPLVDIMNAIIDEKLDETAIKLEKKEAVCVIVASGGYPLEYTKFVKIDVGEPDGNVTLFHAGTKLVDNELRTSGGRVMGVFSMGDSKEECAKAVYKNIGKISFDGMHYRKDIAKK